MKNPETDALWGYVLRTGEGHDLDGYLFSGWTHAEEWMAQGYITDSGYAVHAVLYRRERCCDQVRVVRRGARVLPGSSEMARAGRGSNPGAGGQVEMLKNPETEVPPDPPLVECPICGKANRSGAGHTEVHGAREHRVHDRLCALERRLGLTVGGKT